MSTWTQTTPAKPHLQIPARPKQETPDYSLWIVVLLGAVVVLLAVVAIAVVRGRRPHGPRRRPRKR